MTRSAPRLTLMAQEDLKCELFELKKRLHDTASENYLLKVKVRKLQTEVDKKNKQIECLLDPKKSVNVRKIISERGATMIITLKQRNTDLEQALLSKDLYIKKLQTVIDTSKVYSTRETLHKHTTNTAGANLRSRSLSVTPPPKYVCLKSNSDVQMEYVRLAQNLQKIKLAHQQPASQTLLKNEFHSNKSLEAAVDNEPERIDLDEYLMNMISDMDKMKQTIAELSTEQANMKRVLQEKNKNIETLATRVRHLQRRKYKKYSRSPAKDTDVQQNQTPALQNKNQTSRAEPRLATEDESEQKTSLSSSSTSSSRIDTHIDADDDDDVQTGDSIND
ncbi:hypothetical protein CBL_00984 [Carabus blaptoides fortunei]